MEDDEAREPHPLEGEGAERLLQQAFELWINPEVERREAEGLLTTPFEIHAAQRLQWPDGRTEVRLNDEVNGVGSLRAPRAIERGDPIYLSDLDGLVGFDLLPEELDAGHWTVLWTGTRWFCGFNFLKHRARCADLLVKAFQFAQAGEEARDRGHAAVAVDTLYSACELVAKAMLVAGHQLDLEARTHAAVATQLNLWRRVGNVEGAFVDLFNRLGRLRSRYRYDANVSEPMPISEDDLSLLRAMIERGHDRVKPKPPANG